MADGGVDLKKIYLVVLVGCICAAGLMPCQFTPGYLDFLSPVRVYGSQRIEEGSQETESELWLETQQQIENALELEEMENALSGILGDGQFSFRDTVKALIRGDIPFEAEEILNLLLEVLMSEVRQQKTLVIQVMLIVLTAAVFSNFTRVFRSSQVADICFYMMYLLISVILMKSFEIMNQVACDAVKSLISLMRVILPSYLLTIVFCAGTITATGISEILLFAFTMLEAGMVEIMIPAVNFYLVLLILNQMSNEDYFSKFAELLEMGIGWGIKTVLAVIVGLQTVQCLITPAVDSLKNGMLHKAAKALPWIGNTLDAAAETIAGSAVVIKNAVGTAGVAAILFLCLVPVVKLFVCILSIRVLCAVIQPVGEKRLVECISSVAKGASLLLRIVFASMGVFMISIAMITAMVKG